MLGVGKLYTVTHYEKLASKPLILKQSERQGGLFYCCTCIDESGSIDILAPPECYYCTYIHSLSSYRWLTMRGVSNATGSKFISFVPVHAQN